MSKNQKTLSELVIDIDRDRSRSKSPARSKKPRTFSKQEELTLLKAIEIFGLQFGMIGKMLPQRTQTEIKRKYKNMMRRDKNRVLEAINKDKQSRTKYLLTQEVSLSKTGSVTSNCSTGSIGKRLCRRVKEMVSTPSVEETQKKWKAIQEKKAQPE